MLIQNEPIGPGNDALLRQRTRFVIPEGGKPIERGTQRLVEREARTAKGPERQGRRI